MCVCVHCVQEDVGGTTYFYVHDESNSEQPTAVPAPQVKVSNLHHLVAALHYSHWCILKYANDPNCPTCLVHTSKQFGGEGH